MAKLTLTVDEGVIARAKRHAAAGGTSLSALVEEYLDHIVNPPKPRSATPIMDELIGILEGAYPDPESAIDDYYSYLEKKHR